MPPVDVEASVVANVRLSSEYNVLTLAASEIAARAAPGQFVMLRAGRSHDPLLRRPFSIFEVVRDAGGTPHALTVLSKRVGLATRLIFDAPPGETLSCLGPLGRPFEPVEPPASAWMVAGGVGLAPFVTLAEALRARQTPTTLFYGARRASELFCLDVFERLGVRLVLATEDGSRGHHGLVTVPLEHELQAASSARPTVYACGPEPMLAAVARLASRHRRPSQVSMERVMGCGLGGCYSCVVAVRDERGHTQLVRSCLAGPVFRGDEVVWDA